MGRDDKRDSHSSNPWPSISKSGGRERNPEEADSRAPKNGAPEDKKNILIVEDEPHMAELLSIILTKENHNVVVRRNGAAAVEEMLYGEYDAISLDYEMPGMNGMEAYLAIRETDKDTPIIFVSGNIMYKHSMNEILKNDPKSDYISKPFDTIEYVNIINKWISG